MIAIPIYFSFNSSAILEWKNWGSWKGKGDKGVGRVLDDFQNQSQLQKRDYQLNPVKSCDAIWRSSLIGFMKAFKW